MLTVIIKNDGEPNVVGLTYQNLWKELKDIPEAELIVAEDWFGTLPRVKTPYVCFVEADCLVNSGYFTSMVGLYKKSRMLRKLAMLSSSTGVNNWANKFYGYSIKKEWTGAPPVEVKQPFVQPNKEMKSRGVYPVQIGYVPGALIHVKMLRVLLDDGDFRGQYDHDLVELSTRLSLGFWRQGDGNRVHINPNGTYVTTESYVNDLGKFDPKATDLMEMFERETI